MMPKYPLLAWPKDFKMLHFPLYIYGPREKEILEVLKGSSVGWMARLFGIGPLLASCLALDIYLKPLIIDFKCIPLLCVSCATLSLSQHFLTSTPISLRLISRLDVYTLLFEKRLLLECASTEDWGILGCRSINFHILVWVKIKTCLRGISTNLSITCLHDRL